MRFCYYKLINDMVSEIKSAIKYMKTHNDTSMTAVCMESLRAITQTLASDISSLKSDALFGLINEIVGLFGGNVIDFEKLEKSVENLSFHCKNDISYRLKVLFVAELGGKWDSMASVYSECINRDDMEVDVVMQPIFRETRLPDGSVRHEEVHGDWLTPLGIKHIPCTQYDISKVMPDITFFSQPYESVTTPMFWPENMCKYTRVVYLPYFTATTLSKLSSAFNSFFRLDTQQYSWRIACQSDVMKKYYELFGSRHGENVIACGLPKWDYPMSLSRENTPCPQEWKDKLKNRKVFLWNTHFTLLSNGNRPFKNELEIIKLFSERDDIALIWRPHPMTETVLKTNQPQFYPMFEELKEIVEKSPNMLIDRYSVYDNSFVWSDALISTNFSSIIDQYILMDKPFTLCEYLSEDDVKKKFFSCDNLFDFSNYDFTYSVEEISDFINDVIKNNNRNVEKRKKIRSDYYKYADGKVGKRLVQRLVEDFMTENGLLTRPQIEVKNKSTFLIVGSETDSAPCVKQLEKNGSDYLFCTGLLPYEICDKGKSFDVSRLKPDSFERIIITDKRQADSISKVLTEIYGIPDSVIVFFWKLYRASLPDMVCDRIMMNPEHQRYDGLILGISHTEVGIIAERLKGQWCNLAVSSQDLYYQKKTLEHCIGKYKGKLSSLKYAIIDLYDYQYFNYDTSLSTSAVKYLTYGGYNLDPHNFERNKSFDHTFDEYCNAIESSRRAGLSSESLKFWEENFRDIWELADYEGFVSNFDIKSRTSIVRNEHIAGYNYTSGSALKIFESTVKENIHNLYDIMDILLSINPEIKVYAVVIPKYIETELNHIDTLSNHILYFDEIVRNFENHYDFTFLDFKKISDISSNRSYYFDAAHLNYFGAKYMTDMLNEIIFGREN